MVCVCACVASSRLSVFPQRRSATKPRSARMRAPPCVRAAAQRRGAQLGDRVGTVVGRIEDVADEVFAQRDRGRLADVVGHDSQPLVQPRRDERVEGHVVDDAEGHAPWRARCQRRGGDRFGPSTPKRGLVAGVGSK